jgi:hypothetical protein
MRHSRKRKKNQWKSTKIKPQCFHSGQNELAPAAAADLLVTKLTYGTLRFRREQLLILPLLVEICDQSYWFTRENLKNINQKWELLG